MSLLSSLFLRLKKKEKKTEAKKKKRQKKRYEKILQNWFISSPIIFIHALIYRPDASYASFKSRRSEKRGEGEEKTTGREIDDTIAKSSRTCNFMEEKTLWSVIRFLIFFFEFFLYIFFIFISFSFLRPNFRQYFRLTEVNFRLVPRDVVKSSLERGKYVQKMSYFWNRKVYTMIRYSSWDISDRIEYWWFIAEDCREKNIVKIPTFTYCWSVTSKSFKIFWKYWLEWLKFIKTLQLIKCDQKEWTILKKIAQNKFEWQNFISLTLINWNSIALIFLENWKSCLKSWWKKSLWKSFLNKKI